MRLKIVLIASTLCVLLNSCQQRAESNKIKTKYYLHVTRIVDPAFKPINDSTGGQLVTFGYNDKGVIISESGSNGSKTVYTQAGNIRTRTTSNNLGTITRKETDFMNNAGKTDSTVYEQGGKVTSAHKYFYDAQGMENEYRDYELRANGLLLTVTWKFHYKDSNLVTETLKIPGSIDTIAMLNPKTLKWDTIIQKVDNQESSIYYDYYFDKLNTTHGTSNSKNLVKKTVEVEGANDTSAVNVYRYTFDNKGRVASEVYESLPGYKSGTTMQLEYDSSAYTYY
jgi:hypothetical protein